MSDGASAPKWHTAAILVARLVFAGLFAMAAWFKFAGIEDTAGYIASAGFPAPLFLAWVAAIFEVVLVLGLLTGAYFAEVSLLGAIYVVFLAFAFHGQSHWGADQIGQMEFGAFISHFPFAAGLLFAAVHGPGTTLAVNKTIIGRA